MSGITVWRRSAGSWDNTFFAPIAGLPDADATAALVRVGGTDGAWRGSAGVHDLASGSAADPDARFRAGSTTKVVTAAAVLKLAAEHRIDLGTPVQHYLPGLFTRAFKPITVRQLLNHTSGIQAGDDWGDSFAAEYAHRFDALTPGQVVRSAVAKGPPTARRCSGSSTTGGCTGSSRAPGTATARCSPGPGTWAGPSSTRSTRPDAKGEEMNPVAERIALAALKQG